jgi:hypothetical protein
VTECLDSPLLEKSPFCSFRCCLIFLATLHFIKLLSTDLKSSWCLVVSPGQDLELQFYSETRICISNAGPSRSFQISKIKFSETKVYDCLLRWKANPQGEYDFKSSIVGRK